MRVLGIDPGTVKMGYGVVDSEPEPRADDCGVIALSSSTPLEFRLYQLYTHILNLIHVFNPDAIASRNLLWARGSGALSAPPLPWDRPRPWC